MTLSILFGALAFFEASHYACATEALRVFPISEVRMEGPESKYSAWVARQLQTWPRSRPKDALDPSPETPVRIRCVRTPGSSRYVGAEQAVWVASPLSRIEAVLDAFDEYGAISPGFKQIKLISRQGESARVFWEKRIPIFLIPNLKYETIYLKDAALRGRGLIAYRYKLRSAGHLAGADGFIVLQKAGSKTTRLYRYDFIDPTGGVFQAAPTGRLWHDIFEDLFISNEGVRLKAEHPAWTAAQIVKKTREQLEAFPLENALRNCSGPVL